MRFQYRDFLFPRSFEVVRGARANRVTAMVREDGVYEIGNVSSILEYILWLRGAGCVAAELDFGGGGVEGTDSDFFNASEKAAAAEFGIHGLFMTRYLRI
jgi:hypothetical protein